MKRSVIFFDLDGTLADSMPPLLDLMIRLYAEEFGVPESLSRQHVPGFLRLPRPQMLKALSEFVGVDFAALGPTTARFRERYTTELERSPLELFPEVSDVLRNLCEQGYSLVLTTNAYNESLVARLEAANIRQYFILVFGSNMTLGFVKGPDHIRKAAEEFGVTVEELATRAALVGDSESDMSMAKDAAILAIGRVTNGNEESLRTAGADYLIKDLQELKGVLM